MPIDIIGAIEKWESDDTRQLTFTATLTVPQTVAFHVFNTNGSTLAPSAVQSGLTVSASGGGLFYVNYVAPTSLGLYSYQWTAWDASSRTYILREYLLITRTVPFSFSTYADIVDVLVTGRQVFGRSDISVRELVPYAEAADEEIDLRLAGVSVDSTMLREFSKAGTLYNYFADRYAIEKQESPPAIVKKWDDYKTLMEQIVAGKMGTKPTITTLTGGDTSGFKPVFDSRDFEDQHVDSDLTQYESDRDD